MLRVFALLALMTATGCAAVATTKQPGRHEVGDSYSISTSTTWSYLAGPPEAWTIDGPNLGVLRTWAEVEDGESLFPRAEKKGPVFRSNFSAVEVAELVADTYGAYVAGADVEISNFRPTAFGASEGFRFDFSFVSNGLPRRGRAIGAIRDGELDLILFHAPAEHFFDLRAAEIERIFLSVNTDT
ncbi:MAG: hypothetical protein QNJ67_07575 [Kiloniellales bacterium]|nr:hypothetical protein [Kiloniellales bacterium]